ncbi:MAG: FGLLP motif-containing membrane protein [Acidimicrobiales bacterium]
MTVAIAMAAALLVAGAEGSRAVVYLVTNTNDADEGSLRAAILAANASPGVDTIRFDISVPPDTGGVPDLIATIVLATPLPPITDPVILDGTSQAGYSDRPLIEIRGAREFGDFGVQPVGPGLVLAAGSGGSTVRGLSLTHFTAAVVLSGDGNAVEDSWIGLGADGASRPNVTGVQVDGNFNTVGRGNVISTNEVAGVSITGDDNVVVGNIVGLDPTGTVAAGNLDVGVLLGGGAARTRIGGTDPLDRNVISGNDSDGIRASGAVATVIVGNYVGPDAAGAGEVGNGRGILLDNSPATIGGTAPGSGNVVSGNTGFGPGIAVRFSDGTVIQGNFIGTDAAGTQVLGNAEAGLSLFGGGDYLVVDNVIAGNQSTVFTEGGPRTSLHPGIRASFVSDLTIQGNRIGLGATGGILANRDGIQLSDSSGIVVGGTGAGEGNVISGNGASGIALVCSDSGGRPDGTTIQGNLIGTDETGTLGAPNELNGITVECGADTLIGGSVAGAGNVIAANGGHGVFDAGTGDFILGNRIGVDASGSPLGNMGSGVFITSNFPEVGGNTPEAGNIIAFNVGAGVTVADGVGNPIRLNSIHDNGGLGIDLNDDGPSPNDPGDEDGLANLTQNFPVLSSVIGSGSVATISGALDTLPGSYFVDFYGNPAAAGAEGETYLGSITVEVVSEPASFSAPGIPVTSGSFVTATATDVALLNTSEFSPAVAAEFPPGITLETSAGVPVGGQIFATATLTGDIQTPGTIRFSVYGPDDATCSAAPAATSTVAVSSDQFVYQSPPFTPTAAGTYRWVAEYEVVDVPTIATACNDPGTTVVVSQAAPAVTTQASPGVTVGGSIFDTATVTGGFNPTGSVTFRLYGPDDSTCTSAAVSTGSAPLTVNGTATSPSFAPSLPGTYRWVASYGGDPNNLAASGACNDPNESVVVAPAPTTTTSSTTTSTTTTLPPTTMTSTSTTTSSTTTSTSTSTSTSTTVPPTTTTTIGTTTTSSTTVPPTTTTTSTTTTSTTTTEPPTTEPPTTEPPTTTVPTTTSSTTTVATTTVATTTVPTTTVPTTTTSVAVPPGTTTTEPSTAPPATATPPAGAVTTTSVSSPTTVPASTTLPPTTAATTTTTAPATTTTRGPGPAAPLSTIDAVNTDGDRSGPPGVGLDVSGGGYLDCRTAYFFFDGVRIGSATPNAAGAVNVGLLSVPGDADPGEHRVTSSCRSSGDVVRASSTFGVTEASVHRSAFATSLAGPDQISLEFSRIMASGALAGLAILLFAFPSKLFNAAVEENYDEIRGWFRMPARVVDAASSSGRAVTFVVMNLLAAISLGFLSPDFSLDYSGIVIAISFFLSFVVMSAGYGLPAAISIHRETGSWAKLNFLPGTLILSAVMVAISRLLDFQPGYFYGAIAGLAFAGTLSAKRQGRLTAANWTWALLLSLAAWFARVPVSEAAAQPDASAWWIGLEAGLALTFLWGIESLVVAMLPMRFLDGPKVKAWNRWVWLTLLFVGVVSVVHVLLTPSSGYVGHTTGEVTFGVMVIFTIFCLLSVGAWAYFRYRPERWVPRSAR